MYILIIYIASWLHEHDPSTDPSNPLSIMAKRLNLSLKNTNFDNGIAFDLKGNRIKDKIVEKVFNIIYVILITTNIYWWKTSL
jgi:hypothetical protein